jgi:hypothetical protein
MLAGDTGAVLQRAEETWRAVVGDEQQQVGSSKFEVKE